MAGAGLRNSLDEVRNSRATLPVCMRAAALGPTAILSVANAERAGASIALKFSAPFGRAAIVSIPASDCRIDLAIQELLAIEAGDAEPRWCLARRSGTGHRRVMRLLRRPQPGREQALGPRAGSSKQQ